MAHVSTSTPSPMRILGIAWLVVSAPLALLASTLGGLAERTEEQLSALVFFALAASGVILGVWILRTGHGRAPKASLAVSGLWLVGAVVLVPLQQFAADVVVAAGPPLVGALVTTAIVWWVGRRRPA